MKFPKDVFLLYNLSMNFDELDRQADSPELDVVRIVSLKNSKVLLVKESDDPNWKLPGGKIHAGETIYEAVVRELDEELGAKIARTDIINYKSAKIPHSENIRYILLVTSFPGDSIAKTDEVEEFRYFSLNALPVTKFREHIRTAVEIVSS